MKIVSALRKALLWLSYPIRKNPFFFLFMYLLVVFSFYYEDLPTSEVLFYEGLFVDCYFLCAILLLLPHKIRSWVKCLFYFIGYTVTYVEWFLYARFWLRYTPTTIQLALETNQDEASDFINAYLWNGKLWEVTWMIGSIGVVNLLLEIYGARVFGAVRKCVPSRPRSVLAMLFGLSCISYTGYCLYTTREDKAKAIEYFSLNGAERIERVMGPIRFYSPMYRLAYSFKFTQLTAGEVEILRRSMHKIEVDSCAFTCPNIVFVIGESYNKRHSQLYGYSKETTPYMQKRFDNGEIIRFTDVVTPWNVTSNAFKSFLSTHSDDESGLWADGVLFPALFKKAGYTVSLFTQQFMKSTRLAAADFNGSFFLNDEELDSLCFDVRNKTKWKYDGGLIKEYGKHTGAYGKYNLIVFHLIGQHVDYSQRYPESEKQFIAGSIERMDLTEKERKIVADYDNATYYNDKVINSICNLFSDKDAILIYMPDHGEEVYDEIRAFGRLHDANMSPALVRAEFEIPFVVWGSKIFRKRHKALFDQLKAISNKPFKTDDIAHFFLNLGGIKTPFYDKTRDWLSPDYIKHPRKLKHTLDYDSLMRSEPKPLFQ
ncbi:MAG: phosphoethanolamine transferase [Bacteroidaceae bacterium]|nr:phosphoethanolamine transferase [Bacteroidaceae bacterium]